MKLALTWMVLEQLEHSAKNAEQSAKTQNNLNVLIPPITAQISLVNTSKKV